MKYTTKQIMKAVEIASSAFWADIAVSFPEVTNGDFDIMDAVEWESNCFIAVKNWLEFNSNGSTETTSGSAVENE